jgi:hypothetical protein
MHENQDIPRAQSGPSIHLQSPPCPTEFNHPRTQLTGEIYGPILTTAIDHHQLISLTDKPR